MNSTSIERARESLQREFTLLRGKILQYSLLTTGAALLGGLMFCGMWKFSPAALALLVVLPIAAFFLGRHHWTKIFGGYYLEGFETLDKTPETAEDYADRAAVFAGQDMLDEAVEDYETALKLEPNDEDFVYDYAYMLWYQKEDGDAALPWVEKLTKIENHNQGEAFCMKGEILGQTDLDAALKWIDRAIEIDDDSDFYQARVKLFLLHDRLDDAEAALEQTDEQVRAEGYSGGADLSDLRGRLAMKRGEYPDAVKHFTQAIKHAGATLSKGYYEQRAEAYDALGDLDKADADRRKAERTDIY